MLPSLAAVAAAIEEDPHPEHRAMLEELALGLLRLAITRREIAQMRALLCRLTLDGEDVGGDDDRRDAAAA